MTSRVPVALFRIVRDALSEHAYGVPDGLEVLDTTAFYEFLCSPTS